MDFININDAAKMLAIHPTTLHSWIKKDEKNKKDKVVDYSFHCPKYFRMGSRYRFKVEDIEKFIKECGGQ